VLTLTFGSAFNGGAVALAAGVEPDAVTDPLASGAGVAPGLRVSYRNRPAPVPAHTSRPI
jgi:hypothetical protein